MNELISIIIPVYNVEQYLDRCVQSVRKQTYDNLEIILVDDGSPDNCGKMCDEYEKNDSRIHVVHKINEGLGFARNSGLDISHGKYVAFVDSDDYVSYDYIQCMYESINHYSADTCICGITNFYSDGLTIERKIYNEAINFTNDAVVDNILLEMIGSTPEKAGENSIPMSVWHVLYSMEIINKKHIRFHSEREFISEDIVFQIDYFQCAKSVVIIPDTLYFYFSSQKGSLSTKYRQNRFAEEKKLAIEMEKELSKFLNRDRYILRTQRMFLGRVRTCLMMEYCNKCPKNFNEIINDNLVIKILNEYPIGRCPLRLRLFNSALKKKKIKLLKILLWARKAKR